MSQKTEEPTPRRLRQAREQGDSAVSPHAAQAVAFLVAVAALPAAAIALADWASGALRETISRAGHGEGATSVEAWTIARPVLLLCAPILLAVGAAAAGATLVQTGGVFSMRKLTPTLRRLGPLQGMRMLFSPDQLFAVARAFVAAGLIAYLAYLGLRAGAADMARLAGRPERVLGAGATIALRVTRNAAFLGVAMGLVDALIRRRSWLTRLRMSKEEVQRERKESEGNPAWKAARARAHQERMASATRAEIRLAAVLITGVLRTDVAGSGSPLACALRYHDGDRAPVLIACAEGLLAEELARTAREGEVPIVEDSNLAGALKALTVGEEIPERLYDGAADAIHRARQMRG